MIVFLPIIATGVSQRTSVASRLQTSVVQVSDSGTAARMLSDYLQRRNPVVDLLLPEGSGGTHYVVQLPDSVSGVAYQDVAAIAIAVDALNDGETVELHERAHLFQAASPRAVGRLMAALPAPLETEYAATNSGEHFAEMAASAWSLIRPIEGFCPIGGPAEQLAMAEERVPGTSLFLLWYLDQPALAAHPDRAVLRAAAEAVATPYLALWRPLTAVLHQQQQAAGHFTPWPSPDVHATLAFGYERDRESTSRFLRLTAPLQLPAIVVAGWLGK